MKKIFILFVLFLFCTSQAFSYDGLDFLRDMPMGYPLPTDSTNTKSNAPKVKDTSSPQEPCCKKVVKPSVKENPPTQIKQPEIYKENIHNEDAEKSKK